MKVLVAHSRYSADPTTGENVHVERETAALERAGVDVVRYLPSSGERSAARLALRSLWSREAARDIARLVRTEGVDLMHLHNVQPMLSPAAISAARRAGVPVVATVHNYRFRCLPAINFRDGAICHDCRPANAFVPGVVHRCYRGSVAGSAVAAAGQLPARATRRRVSRWLAISAHVAQRMRDDGFAADAITVHHNFCPDPAPDATAARTDEVLYAGKLTTDKGVALLLSTWTRAPDVPGRLLIAGQGPLEGDVRALAARDPRVRYLGSQPVDALNAIRARCAAAIVPSLWEEPFGLSAIEALAAGAPVVTTGRGGLAEIVDAGAGWVVEPTEHGLAAGLAAAVAERGARSAAARARYLAAFTETAAVQRLLGVYAEVLSDG